MDETHLSLGRRFTPTCVGKTRLRKEIAAPRSVHPHVRGEDCKKAKMRRADSGSPPRAWGRQTNPVYPHTHWKVHPHVRGEDTVLPETGPGNVGSPPRAWGRPVTDFDTRRITRFTPTCVGKTPGPRRNLRQRSVHPHVRGEDRGRNAPVSGEKVHPHVRGEDPVEERNSRPPVGSPPRAWGRLQEGEDAQGGFRFTPTCVGKTNKSRLSAHALEGSPPRAWGRPGLQRARSKASVHPHVRGEDYTNQWMHLARRGSPPRAWGRHQTGIVYPAPGRFTPTCVGKTMAFQLAELYVTVHPHVRGEDDGPVRLRVQAFGSPPRAWGRHTRIL